MLEASLCRVDGGQGRKGAYDMARWCLALWAMGKGLVQWGAIVDGFSVGVGRGEVTRSDF